MKERNAFIGPVLLLALFPIFDKIPLGLLTAYVNRKKDGFLHGNLAGF
jgi:hypothetical protein